MKTIPEFAHLQKMKVYLCNNILILRPVKKLFFVLAACVLVLASCKKDTSHDNIANPTISDYSKLAVGNYWIYQTYQTDTNGVVNLISFTGDSTFISKDTLINGIQYFKMVKARRDILDSFYVCVRDSADCLVDNTGRIYFSTGHYNDTLYVHSEPGYYRTAYFMTDINIPVTVPAGNFISSNFCGHTQVLPPYNNWNYPQYLNNRYGLGVGLLYSNSFFIGAHYLLERKLVRYHVQ